jgi:hypothetical protein
MRERTARLLREKTRKPGLPDLARGLRAMQYRRGTAMSEFFKPVNLVSLALAVIGVVLAVYFYLSTLPVTNLQYVSKTELVASLDHPDPRLNRPDLTIAKDGEVLDARSLYRTVIGIWNSGTVPLDPSQVRRNLTAEFPSADKILDAQTLLQSSSVINLVLAANDRSVVGKWDHLDPRYFIGIAVYHYQNQIPQVSLRYIGDEEIARKVATELNETYYPIAALIIVIVIVIVCIAGANAIGKSIDNYFKIREWVSTTLVVLVGLLGMFYLFNFVTTDRIYIFARGVFGTTIPKEISDLIPSDTMPFARTK